ncbi:hypothetical protein F170042I7_28040 [Blautia caecimuris]
MTVYDSSGVSTSRSERFRKNKADFFYFCFYKSTINKKQQKTIKNYTKNLVESEQNMLLFVDAQGRMAYNGCI